ncbi:hypothetical protein O6H91_12G062900 [Diphasiastrum complanatum]|uniref:Uncharacterized protein n=1 Tax=Diphasiastrum complanatum TaxID=34168 RepID=A0ACC2C2J4_DIPCM|nr:hypothetical protein O6H91_12G062900 [Diphasiastrum complanatum]
MGRLNENENENETDLQTPSSAGALDHSSLSVVVDGSDQTDSLTEPLLRPEPEPEEQGQESSNSHVVSSSSREQPERLASLDVFRGLSIAGMILVDNVGGLWPALNHSPWNGVTVADFVMPFFLFIVGMALALTFKRIHDRLKLTQKALVRAAKLFFLGVLLQGGYYHGVNHLDYGVDIEVIRWCGVLQRIAFCYLVVALCKIWLPKRQTSDGSNGSFKLLKVYLWHCIVALLFSAVYLSLLYGLYVTDWQFSAPLAYQGYLIRPSLPKLNVDDTLLTVKCGVRGDLRPACNAVGYVDRLILGLSHLDQRPVFIRTKECSVNSPNYGPPPPNAPVWCQAPFDPEGILSSVSAVVTCFVGLHYGHILVHEKGHMKRLQHWITPSLELLVFGIILNYLGMPLNKPLYSFSYMCLTAGAAGLVFCAFYFLIDVKGWRYPTLLLEWMGLNSLLIYTLAACGVILSFIQGFYYKVPQNNLVSIIVELWPWHHVGLGQKLFS